MEKSSSLLRISIDDLGGFRCSGCNETFSRPLLATDSSGGRVHVYYACPRCLSKVNVVKEIKRSEKEESRTVTAKARKVADEHANAGCKHFLGYLKKRPKNTPIPDECLTCERMIECLAY